MLRHQCTKRFPSKNTCEMLRDLYGAQWEDENVDISPLSTYEPRPPENTCEDFAAMYGAVIPPVLTIHATQERYHVTQQSPHPRPSIIAWGSQTRVRVRRGAIVSPIAFVSRPSKETQRDIGVGRTYSKIRFLQSVIDVFLKTKM